MAEKDVSRVDIRLAFCLPDVYEAGISRLGAQALYFYLNERVDAYCERSYAPWPGMGAATLFALETCDPVKVFDFMGFTLQCELGCTTALNMLDLAGIPLLAAERGEGCPIVCAGGPSALNKTNFGFTINLYILKYKGLFCIIQLIIRTHSTKSSSQLAAPTSFWRSKVLGG
ncbi:MAG: hypothetical protein LBU32_33205 [Clostridiales bacterium]|nr:hypothetical protein [Clostridiales bacterium]